MINADGRKVRITVENLQRDTDPEPQTAVYEGLLRREGERWLLLYEEESEGQKTKNRLTFTREELVIRKSGAVSGSLVYRQGSRVGTQYDLGFAVMQIENDTAKVVLEETENGIIAQISYRLTINGSFVSECELKITAYQV